MLGLRDVFPHSIPPSCHRVDGNTAADEMVQGDQIGEREMKI
jgi:hypothetical protein